jgi:adhesin/invasin
MQEIVWQYPDTQATNRILVDTRISFSAADVEQKLSGLGVKAKIEQLQPSNNIQVNSGQSLAEYAIASLSGVYDQFGSRVTDLFLRSETKPNTAGTLTVEKEPNISTDLMQKNTSSIEDDRVGTRTKSGLATVALGTEEKNKVSDIKSSKAPLSVTVLPTKLPNKKPDNYHLFIKQKSKDEPVEPIYSTAASQENNSNSASNVKSLAEEATKLTAKIDDENTIDLLNSNDDMATGSSLPETSPADEISGAENLSAQAVSDTEVILEKEVATVLKEAAQNENSPEKAAMNSAVNQALETLSREIEKTVPRTRFEITSSQGQKPEFRALTVQPLFESSDLKHTIFTQGSASSHYGGDRTTLNIGLGHRVLTPSQHWLLGYNVFFDNEFPHDHQRVSAGLELKSSALQLTTNVYKPLTGLKQRGDNPAERALGGYDYEIGMQIPYMPSTRLFAKRFVWKSESNASDLTGYQYALQFRSFLKDGWLAEARHIDNDNQPDNLSVQLSYLVRIGDEGMSTQETPIFSSRMFESSSMKGDRLTPVRRENRIITETNSFTISYR